MLSTEEAFEKFRQRLELGEMEQQDAEKRHADVRDCIRIGFDVKSDFLSGSYKRHTKTKPLKDVDVMFVLGSEELWRRDRSPIETLGAFETHLRKTYTGKDQVEIGRRSVSVEFEKTYYPEDHDGKVMGIDAVPAFESGSNYEIPDKATGTWIKTNPEKHREQSTAKNKALGGKWVPLVKMIKGWNRANGKPIKPSFLVEVMAESLIDGPFSSYSQEVRNFFAAAYTGITQPWPDPAGFGPPVSDQMTPQLIAAAQKALKKAQDEAAFAARAELSGRQGDALRIWRDILGDYFPLS